jgi:fructose-1,6-bisphosphatase/inositol monophosphatase family enzyme
MSGSRSLEARLSLSLDAAEALGGALVRLSRRVRGEERGDQLKTAVDRAAESFVLELLRGEFPGERILAEEDFEEAGQRWDAPRAYWTVDALDGTRSFVEGFAGYCVQVAWVEDGRVRVGVVHEPALDQTYYAIEGGGAFRRPRGGEAERLAVAAEREIPRFVDSTRPRKLAGQWFARKNAELVELGSIGLKICRVADGTADIFLKELRFKLWDVAPGALVLAEAGGRLGLWDGGAIDYAGQAVHYQNILATTSTRYDDVVRELYELSSS